MAAPNLNALTTITGKTAHLALTNTAADIIAAVASGHVIGILGLSCANITAASHPVSLFLKQSGTSYPLAQAVNVAGIATYDAISKVYWLEEGDSLTGNSDASSQITVNVSYVDCS